MQPKLSLTSAPPNSLPLADDFLSPPLLVGRKRTTGHFWVKTCRVPLVPWRESTEATKCLPGEWSWSTPWEVCTTLGNGNIPSIWAALVTPLGCCHPPPPSCVVQGVARHNGGGVGPHSNWLPSPTFPDCHFRPGPASGGPSAPLFLRPSLPHPQDPTYILDRRRAAEGLRTI